MAPQRSITVVAFRSSWEMLRAVLYRCRQIYGRHPAHATTLRSRTARSSVHCGAPDGVRSNRRNFLYTRFDLDAVYRDKYVVSFIFGSLHLSCPPTSYWNEAENGGSRSLNEVLIKKTGLAPIKDVMFMTAHLYVGVFAWRSNVYWQILGNRPWTRHGLERNVYYRIAVLINRNRNI